MAFFLLILYILNTWLCEQVAQRMSTLPASAALAKVYIPIAKLPVKAGLLFSGATINAKGSGKGWNGPGRLKGRIIVNGLSSFGRLNELPRNTRQRTPTVNGDSTELEDISKITSFRKGQYNLPDFQTKYDHALFFVIKSYTEDDVHMSIKYDVWASTPNGNKKLDDAYEGAQKKAVVTGSKCPVFLFFSVSLVFQYFYVLITMSSCAFVLTPRIVIGLMDNVSICQRFFLTL